MKDKILIITPLYKIINRDDLFQDSECVHTLVKYWTAKYDVDVLFNYINGFSKLKRIIFNKKISKIVSGYNYNCDGVNVVISERQNIFPKQINGLMIDRYISKNIIKKYNLLGNYKFLVVHLPSTSQFLINNFKHINNKYAVIHQTDLQYLRKHPKKFKKYLEDNFQKVFCRSSSIYREMSKYNIVNLEKSIISSGVDTIPLKKKRTFNSKKLKFLYVGKLIKRKKLDILINALSNFDKEKWELSVIGVGPMKDKYIKLAKKLKLDNIHFLGSKSHDVVLTEMEKNDVFCMPSINETLGLVYLEAMSKGCITIGTKNEGIDGIIVNNENGFLIEPNEQKLSECIEYIYSCDKIVKEEISNNAIKTAINCNEKKMSNYYLESILENID